MNPPAEDMEIRRDKIEEKEAGPSFCCDLYDTDLVHKIAETLLPGLASACIDNTTGGLLRSPASVAVDIRREMVDYLVQRSENFVAESVVLEGGPESEASDNPFDTIQDFVDDFASSKRNFLSRVSGWVLSERREDRIDDLVQEMEINGFWLLNRREAVAQTLLKNIDFKNTYHCGMKFKSPEELEEHKLNCGFRTLTCTSEGCDSTFSASMMEDHDNVCPFKIIPCEQNCSSRIMRRDMDRHCITVCPMKLVKCPFYSVGCQSTVPHMNMDLHRSSNLSSHLLLILQVIHKEVSQDDLKVRVKEIEEASTAGKLATSRDARTLTSLVKDLEAKLGAIKITPKPDLKEEVADSTEQKQEGQDSATNEDGSTHSPSKKEESVKSSSDSPTQKDKSVEPPANTNEQVDPQVEKDEHVKSPSHSSPKKDDEKDEHVKSPSASSPIKDTSEESPAHTNESQPGKEELKEQSVVLDSSSQNDKSIESNEQIGSPPKEDESVESAPVAENLKESTVGLVEAKTENLPEDGLVKSQTKEGHVESPKKNEASQ